MVARATKITRDFDMIVIGNGKAVLRRSIRTCDLVGSVPAVGNFPITNMYIDAATRKLVIEYDDTPASKDDC